MLLFRRKATKPTRKEGKATMLTPILVLLAWVTGAFAGAHLAMAGLLVCTVVAAAVGVLALSNCDSSTDQFPEALAVSTAVFTLSMWITALVTSGALERLFSSPTFFR